MYDTTSWQEVAQYVHHDKSTNQIEFAPDNDTFAVSSSDRTISLWKSNGTEPSAILKGHRNTVMGLSWSPDGSCLASAATTPRSASGTRPARTAHFLGPYRIGVRLSTCGRREVDHGRWRREAWYGRWNREVAPDAGHDKSLVAMQSNSDASRVYAGLRGAIHMCRRRWL